MASNKRSNFHKKMHVWPDEAVERFWDVCKAVFDIRTAKLLEIRLRKGSGTESYVNTDCCHDNSKSDWHTAIERLTEYCFKKSQGGGE